MPISSGAEGHVGVGVDVTIRWIPEGGNDYKGTRNHNSYLQRYNHQYAMGGKMKREETHMQSSNERLNTTRNTGEQIAIQNTKSNTQHNVSNKTNAASEASKETPITTARNKTMSSTMNSDNNNSTPKPKSVKKSSVCVIL